MAAFSCGENDRFVCDFSRCAACRHGRDQSERPVRDVRVPSRSHADPPGASFRSCVVARLPLTLVRPKEVGFCGAAAAVRHEQCGSVAAKAFLRRWRAVRVFLLVCTGVHIFLLVC